MKRALAAMGNTSDDDSNKDNDNEDVIPQRWGAGLALNRATPVKQAYLVTTNHP